MSAHAMPKKGPGLPYSLERMSRVLTEKIKQVLIEKMKGVLASSLEAQSASASAIHLLLEAHARTVLPHFHP